MQTYPLVDDLTIFDFRCPLKYADYIPSIAIDNKVHIVNEPYKTGEIMNYRMTGSDTAEVNFIIAYEQIKKQLNPTWLEWMMQPLT
jgi:hypothetical protein